MKKFTLILTAMVLFAGVSFAQQNPDPAKNIPTKSEKAPKADKKTSGKKEAKKAAKKDASNKAAK